MDEASKEVEKDIELACDAGDYDTAATLAIQHYGREILGFLVVRMRSEDEASEVFSSFSEDFWKGLPKFQWRCTARTWAYKLARHAAVRHREAARRKEDRNVPLSRASKLSRAVARVRTATLAHLRTEVKSRFQELREQLPPEDQTILILRVDRRMSWLELAEVMFPGDEADEAGLKKEAARLRKRFQAAKERLRAMAEAEGLLDASE